MITSLTSYFTLELLLVIAVLVIYTKKIIYTNNHIQLQLHKFHTIFNNKKLHTQIEINK
jgi:hypothetical protein